MAGHRGAFGCPSSVFALAMFSLSSVIDVIIVETVRFEMDMKYQAALAHSGRMAAIPKGRTAQ